MVVLPRTTSQNAHRIDKNAETPFDEVKRDLVLPNLNSGETGRLRTLGDGPCAPGAAADAAQTDGGDTGAEVSPGYKGWINLIGVSPEVGVDPAANI